MGHTDDNGRTVHVATLTTIHYKVLAEEGGWLKVKTAHGVAGWFDKNDAVLEDDAVGYFTNRIRQNPDDAAGYNYRAAAWRLKGELDIALKDYGEALRLRPIAAHYNNRGTAWHDKKEYDQAIADYSEALRLDPSYARAYNGRGIAWGIKKNYDRAIGDFSEAIRIDPKHALAYRNRGYAWSFKNEHDKAIADYSEAIRLAPQDATAFRLRGAAWSAQKTYSKAIADYSEALRLDPKNSVLPNHLAWLLATAPDAKVRDGKRAVELAKRALEIDPKSADYMDTLAAAYAEVADFDEAVRWQERALDRPEAKTDEGYRRRLELYKKRQPYRQE